MSAGKTWAGKVSFNYITHVQKCHLRLPRKVIVSVYIYVGKAYPSAVMPSHSLFIK